MIYKVVIVAKIDPKDDESKMEWAEYKILAGNTRKASNKAKRKFCLRTGCEWKDCQSRVSAVFRWLPGWIKL